ncbi:MAG TPA: sigma-70 family RNA polymerase sigma factor, partial [Urbifossiella sp.]|nr:sigma-70 family RNA polymerase sigma factor [Urbifossiella sp.]
MPTAPLSLMPALRRVIAGRAADRSDADLLAAFVDDRDPEAFAALVRRHGPMVLGVCRRVVRDPDAADDAFQAVFLVLARRAAEVRPRNRVGGWLYGVAYRTALKARAVRARRRTRESQVDAMPEPAAPPAADGWDDLKPVLDEELARLPDRLRVPVVLCDLEGRPQRAVAGQLGIAPATLAGRLADARRTLAARLTRRGVALSAAALGALLAERGATAAVAPGLAAGVVRAAEAVAAGGAAAGLVSANALQLCDGVMRMIFLTKLKTAAATAVAVLILAGGVGPGLVTVRAQDGREAAPPAAKAGAKAQSDAAFLDRVCLEFRGSKGTPVEHAYFAADADAGKRHKVMNWLLADPAVKAHLDGGASATAVTWLDELYDLGPSGITDLKEITLSADTQFLRVVTDTTTQIIPVPPAPPAADGAKATTLYRRAAVAADTTVQARTVTESVRAAKTSSVAGSVRAAKTSSATGAARVVETVDGTGTRVEVVLEAVQPPGEAKKTAPAPGEPVRVRVVRVIDDGKGNKTVVTEDERGFKVVGPATGAKKIDGGPQGDKLLYDFFYTQPDTGKKTDGKGPAPKVTVWLAEPVPGGKAGA